MTSPEKVIRRYLDEHGGCVDAHVRHLVDSWELREIGEDDLETIKGALAGVGVATEPPLPSVSSDGRLRLYIAEVEEGHPATEDHPAAATPSGSDSNGSPAPTAPSRGGSSKTLRGLAERVRRHSGDAAGGDGPSGAEVAAAVAEERAEESDGPQSPAVASALEALVGRGQRDRVGERLDELASTHQMLRERLGNIGQALERARGVAELGLSKAEGAKRDLFELTTDPDERIAELEQRIESLSLQHEPAAGPREELAAAVLESDRQAELEGLFRALVESEQQAQQGREQRDTEIGRAESELVDARDQVAAPRYAVNQALANPELRSELDERLEALGSAEQRERELGQRQEAEAQRWAGRLEELQVEVNGAREAVGKALFATEHREEAEARVRALLDAESDARRAVKSEAEALLAEAVETLGEARVELGRQRGRVAGTEERLGSLVEAGRETVAALDRESEQAGEIGLELERRITTVQEGVTRAVLGPDRRAELQRCLEEFIESQRQERDADLDAARAEHRQVLEAAEKRLISERDELERRLTSEREEVEQRATAKRDELEKRLASAQKELESRGAELERVKLQAEEWLGSVRDRLAEAEGEL